jgi:two-component system, cell cycle response regulator
MAGGIVLVLEDDLVTLSLVSKQLSTAGYAVTPVVEGRKAIETCCQERPDLVVCDLNMPGMDGFEFIRQLRQKQFGVPIVVVSGLGREKGETALAAGANAFLPKPVDRKLLLSTVQREIDESRVRDRATHKHILVYEDDPIAQRLMRGMLEPAGFRVTAAENGAAALVAVNDDPPDMIVSDLGVPGVGGIQLITRLRQERQYRAPILVVSAHREEEHRQAALNAGADFFLAKPVERTELLARVKELLSGCGAGR